ncbi:hypothetical protein L195_g026359 [Trifolium pratense]|uniref:Uncharacterized protein n=1 Tax=Trifolium pratense TaxID=57577 RepID=A0A2K3NJ13_TRIPR|nr:hypothetical protein L195_g026359 [Trifolium pratense]
MKDFFQIFYVLFRLSLYHDDKSSWIQVDVTLVNLKHQLSQLNSHPHFDDSRRVVDVEYRRLSICSNGTIRLVHQHETSKRDDVRTMFSIFSQYSTKGSIDLDTTLVRSVKAIVQA